MKDINASWCVCVFVCICVCRSVGDIPDGAELECSVLDDAEQLQSGQIELNDLTLEAVQHK